MKFKIKVSHSGKKYRLGVLLDLKNNPDCIYETPLSLAITKGGSIPHLTKDVYHGSFSKNTVLCTPAEHFCTHLEVLQTFKKGVANFACLGTHPVCVVVQDPTQATPPGYNESTFVSLWGSVGRMKINTDKYMKLVKTMRPDWYEALNDADTGPMSSRKRIEKSLRSSSMFLQQCLEIHQSVKELKDVGIFAPLLGGHRAQDRSEWINHLPVDRVDGFSLLGLHQNDSAAMALEPKKLRECVEASLEKLPRDKVRQASGAFSVFSVLELIECGIDVFDSSLAVFATSEGRAFCFPRLTDCAVSENCTPFLSNGHTPFEDVHFPASETLGGGKLQKELNPIRSKRLRLDLGITNHHRIDHSPGSDEVPNGSSTERLNNFEIDLKDKQFASAKESLVPGCKCYTCITFMKSYIHHLVMTKEMLGDVLLMIHNLHEWDLFFETIRKAIKLNQFEFLKEIFTHYSSRDLENS